MILAPNCIRCQRLDADSVTGKGAKCAAFPNGIPAPIWKAENLHTEPYPGDHGIQFELTPLPPRVITANAEPAATA